MKPLSQRWNSPSSSRWTILTTLLLFIRDHQRRPRDSENCAHSLNVCSHSCCHSVMLFDHPNIRSSGVKVTPHSHILTVMIDSSNWTLKYLLEGAGLHVSSARQPFFTVLTGHSNHRYFLLLVDQWVVLYCSIGLPVLWKRQKYITKIC